YILRPFNFLLPAGQCVLVRALPMGRDDGANQLVREVKLHQFEVAPDRTPYRIQRLARQVAREHFARLVEGLFGGLGWRRYNDAGRNNRVLALIARQRVERLLDAPTLALLI